MIIVNSPKKSNPEIDLLVNKLKDKNLVISLTSNSIFHHVEKEAGDFYKDTNVLGKMFAEKLAPIIDLYKNKFIPLAHDIEAKLLEAKTNYTPESKFSRYNIIPVYKPAVIEAMVKKGILNKETSQLDNNVSVPNTFTKNIDSNNVTDIIPLLYTGNYEVDELLKVFLGKYKYEEIITVWNDHVANITNEGIVHVLKYKEFNIDELTLVFIMLDALQNGRIVYEGNNESKYAVDAYYGLVKKALSNVNFLFNRTISLNTLVLEVKETDSNVNLYLNGIAYDKVLEETKNPDLIIGLHLFSQSGIQNNNIPSILTITAEQLLSNRGEIENVINRELSIEKLNSITNEDKLFNNLYLTNSKIIAECIPNDLKDILEYDEQVIKSILDNVIKSFSLEEKRDVFIISCYIIQCLVKNKNYDETFVIDFHHFVTRVAEFDRLIKTDIKEAVNLTVYEFIIDMLLNEVELLKTTEVLNGSKTIY